MHNGAPRGIWVCQITSGQRSIATARRPLQRGLSLARAQAALPLTRIGRLAGGLAEGRAIRFGGTSERMAEIRLLAKVHRVRTRKENRREITAANEIKCKVECFTAEV